jgi:hypothetical protein
MTGTESMPPATVLPITLEGDTALMNETLGPSREPINIIALRPTVSFYEIESVADYLSDIPGLSIHLMEQLMETCPYSMATSISHFLDQRINASQLDITNFGIAKFGDLHLFTWKEKNTCVMGIFKVEHESLPCNHLLHYFRKSSNFVPRQRSISWSVKNMDCLGELFLLFEHVWTAMQLKEKGEIDDLFVRYGPIFDDGNVLNLQTSSSFDHTLYESGAGKSIL